MNQWVRNCTCEAIGTFALTFIGAGAIITTTWTGGQPGLVGIALAHGIALSIAVSAAMNISGGHINPAVTVAMMATGRISPIDGLRYIFAQCLGAAVAGFALMVIFSAVGQGPAGMSGLEAAIKCKLGTPNFDPKVLSGGIAMIVEIILTFLLVTAVFGTAVDSRAPKIGGFGIGLTVGIDILMGGPLTGGAMNPARTIGTALVARDPSLWSQHWVYWLGPIAGAVLAAVLYDAIVLKSPQP